MQKTFIKSLLLIIAFTFALSANYIFAVWTGPTQAPPGGNTPTPVHVGTTPQLKDGALSLNSLAVFGSGFFDGNVGIGTASPSAGGEQNLKLDVEGAIGAKFYCDENGNNCASAPLGGGDGWVDITSDTNPWNNQCEYKWTMIDPSDCGGKIFVGAYFYPAVVVPNGVIMIDWTAAGYTYRHYIHYTNKGQIYESEICGGIVRTYERCGGTGGGGGGGGGGVSKIIAGNNITISPSPGTGEVTINSTANGNVRWCRTNEFCEGTAILCLRGGSANYSSGIFWAGGMAMGMWVVDGGGGYDADQCTLGVLVR